MIQSQSLDKFGLQSWRFGKKMMKHKQEMNNNNILHTLVYYTTLKPFLIMTVARPCSRLYFIICCASELRFLRIQALYKLLLFFINIFLHYTSLSSMCEGEKRKLVIPSDMGYGDRGAPPKIPGLLHHMRASSFRGSNCSRFGILKNLQYLPFDLHTCSLL